MRNRGTGRRLVGLGAAVATAAAMVGTGVASAAPASTARVRLPGTVSAAVVRADPGATVSAAQARTVQFWLTPNTAAATAAANAVSTPGSTRFRHYLTPAQYTANYAAGASAASSVRAWLKSRGYTHVAADAQRDYVRATAPVATIESSLAVRLRHYRVQTAGGTQSIVSNDRAVSLPSDIAGLVLGVTGLDSTRPVTPHMVTDPAKAAAAAKASNCSTYYGQKVKKGLPSYHGSTSYPYALCGYSGAQLRAAYGMTSAATGKGQTVAYVEVGSPYRMSKLLTKWAATNGLPKPKPANYTELLLGRDNQCGNEFDEEEQLDIEAGYAMAPDQHQLLIGGDGCEEALEGVQPLFDADLTVVNGTNNAPLASIASNSWGLDAGETMPAIYSSVAHAILLRAAAEGVGMYFSSGDNPGISVPADDPYAIAVGGTSLGLGAKNQRLFETGWSNQTLGIDKGKYQDEGIGRSAAGGGTSLLWKEPAYQKGVVPAAMTRPKSGDVSRLRAVPDISADADAFTGISQGNLAPSKKGDVYTVFPDGGTSLAAPLVAGMVAAAQQGQHAPLGFLNPALYKLVHTSALHDTLPVTSSSPTAYRAVYCPESNELCFGNSLETFDAQLPAYTDQVTAKGYDTMTGVGSPNGQAFLTALRRLDA